MKKGKIIKYIRASLATLCLLLSCLGFFGIFGEFLQLQLGPAILRSVVYGSLTGIVIALSICILTFIFGRFFCSILCPLGILQEILGRFSRQKGRNITKLRCAIAGIVWGMLLTGWSIGFFFLDPYSFFGRFFSSFTLTGIISLIVLLVLVLLYQRIFCTSICPVGALLSVIARHSIYALNISDKCVKCGKCVKQCPAGSIDLSADKIHNDSCIRCMNCIAECKLGGIVYGRKPEIKYSPERRIFLKNTAIFLAGLAAGAAIAKTGMKKLKEFARKIKILPPGAGNKEIFATRCTGCQLCTKHCPQNIIVPGDNGIGPVHLDFTKGYCQFGCNKCSQICPTGAIIPLSLEIKQRTKLAEAKFDPKKCVVFQNDEECGRCGKICPTKAIKLRKSGAPYPVETTPCIGCGACFNVCPAKPEKAISIMETDGQILLPK